LSHWRWVTVPRGTVVVSVVVSVEVSVLVTVVGDVVVSVVVSVEVSVLVTVVGAVVVTVVTTVVVTVVVSVAVSGVAGASGATSSSAGLSPWRRAGVMWSVSSTGAPVPVAAAMTAAVMPAMARTRPVMSVLAERAARPCAGLRRRLADADVELSSRTSQFP
jgi:hypothetical protein